MGKKKKIYFESLDAIRFLCFLSVYLFHSFHTDNLEVKGSKIYQFIQQNLFHNGNLGVNFFFVLSGFLITYLLIEERRLNGKISIRKFWMRRILRIWPLFYFCVFFGFFAFPFLKSLFGQSSNETANLIYYLTFLNNFDFIKNGLPDASILGVLWSIAIEEQFYLIWPVLLSLFPIKKYWMVFLAILAINIVSRILNPNYMFFEYHTLSCMGDLVIGAFGAWLILEKKKFKQFIVKLPTLYIIVNYILFLLIYLFRSQFIEFSFITSILERLIIAIIILTIILEQSFSKNSIFKFSRLKYFTELGKISYGLYSLHFIGILITLKLFDMINASNKLAEVLIFETLTALVITIILSKLSFRFIEWPFLNLKNKFSFFSK